jgi:hypothetical protein
MRDLKKEARVMRLCFAGMVLILPLAAFAQLSPDSGTDALVAGVIQAIQSGNVGLAVVVALMLVVALIRKVAAPKVAFLAGDVGGTLLNFVTVALVMVTGPVSAGGALTLAVVKTAVLTAFATSGGWTMLKRVLFNPLLPKVSPYIDEKVGQVPVVGLLLKPIVRFLLGRYLTVDPAPAEQLASSKAPLAVAPAAPTPPAPVGGGLDQTKPYDPASFGGN